LKEWCDEIEGKIDLDQLAMPDGIRDRDADIWEPLFALADAAGGDWPQRCKEAANWFIAERSDDEPESLGLLLLRHCAELLEGRRTCEPDWLRRELCNLGDAPWSDLNGKGLSLHQMKQMLKRYGIKTYAVRVGGHPVKGYNVKQFEDELARFSPGSGYNGYNGYNIDNENKDVTDVTNVTHPEGLESNVIPIHSDAICEACDGAGCPTCKPHQFGLDWKRPSDDLEILDRRSDGTNERRTEATRR
jgi:hypothetical protein